MPQVCKAFFVLLVLSGALPFTSFANGGHCPPSPWVCSSYRYKTFKFQQKDVILFGSTERPPVLLLHELPGLTPECVSLAQRIADEGYAVYVPLLFGRVGERAFPENLVKSALGGWKPFAADHTPRPARTLRALTSYLARAHRGQSIGVIGMCYSGTLPLALLTEPAVNTLILCQPARPGFAWTNRRKSAIGLSNQDIEEARKSVSERRISILGFRFAQDKLSPSARFKAIEELFGRDTFHDHSISVEECRMWNIRADAHSVLTAHFTPIVGHPTEQRFRMMINLFNERLSSRAE